MCLSAEVAQLLEEVKRRDAVLLALGAGRPQFDGMQHEVCLR